MRRSMWDSGHDPDAFAAQYNSRYYAGRNPFNPNVPTPSGLARAFQDAAGTNEVTAASQAMSLALDLSEGAALGAELVTNGGFDADSGWVKPAGGTIAGGAAVFTSVTSTQAFTQSVFSETGLYLIPYDIAEYTAGAVSLNGTGGNTQDIQRNAIGSYTEIVRVTNTSAFLAIKARGTTTLKVDNVTCRKISGNYLLQSTPSNAPTLADIGGGYFAPSWDGGDAWPMPSGPTGWAGDNFYAEGYIDASAQDAKVIYAEGSTTDNDPIFALMTGTSDTGALRMLIVNDAGSTLLDVESTIDVCDGSPHWFQVAITETTWAMWVDGVAAGSGSYSRSGTLTLDTATHGALTRASVSANITGTMYLQGFGDTIPATGQILASAAYWKPRLGIS